VVSPRIRNPGSCQHGGLPGNKPQLAAPIRQICRQGPSRCALPVRVVDQLLAAVLWPCRLVGSDTARIQKPGAGRTVNSRIVKRVASCNPQSLADFEYCRPRPTREIASPSLSPLGASQPRQSIFHWVCRFCPQPFEPRNRRISPSCARSTGDVVDGGKTTDPRRVNPLAVEWRFPLCLPPAGGE